MSKLTFLMVALMALLLLGGCGGSSSTPPENSYSAIVVNSLLDSVTPTGGQVTLRSAIELIDDGGTISFDPTLNGETIQLSIVGEEHSILKGEVMGFDYDNNISYLVGYFERDYGKSALYARKNLVIDASELTNGITLEWTGENENPARVLAVFGNLTLNNVTITGGKSVTEEIATYNSDSAPGNENSQPWTLGRGGALAVWGTATLSNCTLYNNHCLGDTFESRDRGAFGGGLYADIVHLTNCIISGNTVAGGGAAGGGVYTVGGADNTGKVSSIEQSSITGNRISGVFTYGGGVYSDGGGIGKLKTLSIKNSTIARNLVEPPYGLYLPFLLPTMLDLGYWRGGGLYMSNGYMNLQNCTIVENEVFGKPRTDSSIKPNLAGGIAATIGNAHAVESMTIQHSIIVDNTVHELDDTGNPVSSYNQDIFTGSLVHFYSEGYNLVGTLNFDHMLAPIPQWNSLNRKHWPKDGDSSGIVTTEILESAVTHSTILSQGVAADNPVPLWYPPTSIALNRIPDDTYSVSHTLAEIDGFNYNTPDTIDDFLPYILNTLEADSFGEIWATDLYTAVEGDPAGIRWKGPSTNWPANKDNSDWINFWRNLDNAIGNNLGIEKLGDEFWGNFQYTSDSSGLELQISARLHSISPSEIDQRGTPRTNGLGDIGAIELSLPE